MSGMKIIRGLREAIEGKYMTREYPKGSVAGLPGVSKGVRESTFGVPLRVSEPAATLPQDQASASDPQGIGWAVKQMHNGARVCRRGWNGKDMWLAYSPGGNFRGAIPGDNGMFAGIMGDLEPFVYMRTAQGTFIPWLCSQTDLLATDWEIAD